jgi:CheY-like chemotaxis protein
VAAWRSGRYDILFLDNHMPRMNGRDAATEIRAAERSEGRARTPIIGITASGLPEERNECIDAGMDALLLKPFRLDDLSRLLHEWLPEPR